MANASTWTVAFLLMLGCSGGGKPSPSAGPSGGTFYTGSGFADYALVIGEAGNVSSSQGGNATFDWFDSNSGFLRLLDRQAVDRPTAAANAGLPIDLIYYSLGSNPDTARFRLATPDFVARTYVDLLGSSIASVPRRATGIRPAVSYRTDPATGFYLASNRADFDAIQNGFDLFALVVFGDAQPDLQPMAPHAEEATVWQSARQVTNDQVFSILLSSNSGLLAGVMLFSHEDNVESPTIRVKLMSPL